jgi:predicted Zn-dependent protease
MIQERATVITTKTKLQGNPAVDEIHWAQLIGLGARDCTSRVTAMSPGKYAQNPVARVSDAATASRTNQTFSFSVMASPHANAWRGSEELNNIQKPLLQGHSFSSEAQKDLRLPWIAGISGFFGNLISDAAAIR